jgi:hypothetical protein
MSDSEAIVVLTEETAPVTPVDTSETSTETVAPVVVELPEQRFEWQPTDEEGRPIGNKQVIKFRTEEEKFAKLIEQNTLILRKLREQTRKNRLGIADDDNVPDSAQKISEKKSFKSRALTADEKIQLARDMQDPDKIENALDRWAEARYGVPIEEQVDAFNTIQNKMTAEEVEKEALAFIESTPDYYGCSENFNVLAGWMAKHKLRASAENWRLAFETNRNLMIIGPGMPAPAAIPSALPAEEPRQEIPGYIPEPSTEPPPTPAPVEYQRITTALNRSNTSDQGTVRTVGSDIVYIIEGRKDSKGNKITADRAVYGDDAIQAMPSDVYRHRLLHENGFAKKVDELDRKMRESAQAKQFAQANG